MNRTVKKIIRLAVFGFLIGIVIGNVISFFTSRKPGFLLPSETLIRKAGSVTGAIILQSLISGLLGAVSMAGSYLYELEDWPMTGTALVHYLLIMSAYFTAAFTCGWIKPRISDILIMSGIMAIAYFLVWLAMYLRYRKETEQLTEEIRKIRE